MRTRTLSLTLAPLALLALAASCAPDTVTDPETTFGEIASPAEVAFPGESGTVQSRMLTVNGVTDEFSFEVMHNQRVFESDIIVGNESDDPQPDAEPDPIDDESPVPDDITNEPPFDPGATVATDDGTTDSELATTTEALTARSAAALWPNGRVFFTIASDLPDKNRVWNAIRHWQHNTPIRFVRRTTQAAYVTFRRGSGCSGNIGRTGGHQFVWLANNCTTGSTIHEIGHTVGLWHEQSRTDRNSFIRIHWDNIIPSQTHNFQTWRQQGFDGRNIGHYDIGSIMHYGSFFFSRNGRPTITTLSGGHISASRTRLSARDIAGVRAIYRQ